MSARRRSGGSRRERGRGQTFWPTDFDDLPLSQLSILAMIAGSLKTTKSRTSQRRGRGRGRAAAAAVRGTRRTAPPTETIILEDTPESTQIMNDVQSRVGTFMDSGSFISSDEDEVEMIRTKTNKQSGQNLVLLSDDSDEDVKIIPQNSNTSNTDSAPSTSTSSNTQSSVLCKSNVMDDDIMEFVESVAPSTSGDNKGNEGKQNNLEDMKTLEDFRKETEAMLREASTLLDEIKTGRKDEPPKGVEGSPKVTVQCCPVCLESLAGRPASVTVCGHIFCTKCISQTAKNLKKCPTCRKNINAKKFHPIYF